LEKVVITVGSDSWECACSKWFDKSSGDKLIVRELAATKMPAKSSAIPPQTVGQKPATQETKSPQQPLPQENKPTQPTNQQTVVEKPATQETKSPQQPLPQENKPTVLPQQPTSQQPTPQQPTNQQTVAEKPVSQESKSPQPDTTQQPQTKVDTPKPEAPAASVSSPSTGELKVNSKVAYGTQTGIVRFIGETKFAPGIWVGTELPTPTGKNNGTVENISYFTCPPNCGLFTRPEKLKVIE